MKQKLLIVARVAHYRYEGRFFAYTAYAREIDLWADLFSEVAIAGTLIEAMPPRDCSPFARDNVRVVPVTDAGGNGFLAKFLQLFFLPKIIWELARYMRYADAIHVRCPCDLGLLGLLMAPRFTRRLIAKYAGQWMAFPREPLAWRFQRAILRSKWWPGPVTVYSVHSDQPSKILPFSTSVLSDDDIHRARISANGTRDRNYFRILFVGRLSKARNVDVLLRAVSRLNIPGRAIECTIVGEGTERANLQSLAAQLEIAERTKFVGGLLFDKVLECYEVANVLVLAAESEGWGKAVTEAMAFGCVCIGGNRGMMPHILGEGRGLLVPPGDADALHQALQFAAEHPEESAQMSRRAAEWAQKLSIRAMRDSLRIVMSKSWNLPVEAFGNNGDSPKLSSPVEPHGVLK